MNNLHKFQGKVAAIIFHALPQTRDRERLTGCSGDDQIRQRNALVS